MEIENIKTFSDVKLLDEAGLVLYAKEVGGVDLDMKTMSKEQLLSKCASIFINKKNIPAASVGKEDPAVIPPVQDRAKDKKALTVKSTKKEEAKKKEDIEKHSKETNGAQDYPRCSVCSVAITTGGGTCSTSGKPLCSDCLTKISTKKEKTMSAKVEKKSKAGNVAKKSTKTATGKKAIAKSPAATDKYGFREGSKGSKLFAALIHGATRPELDKIGGAAVAGFMAGIVKNPKDWSAGRSVKWDEGKREKDIYKIASWKAKA